MSLVLGCIADDLTGATDLAMILVRSGLKTVQIVGVPDEHTEIPDAEAVVVALKSRTIPAKDAVAQSLTSCDWLLAAGAEQIFFKYCSTFDSTTDGNIGPVTDALMARLDCTATIACPSFPENGRTVYRGHLFVNDVLLSESSLRNHPLTPMTDSNLQRVLAPQSQSAVANIYYETIEQGAEAIKQSLDAALDKTIFITDAMTDTHLLSIGKACDGLKLITGGSAVAQGLHANFKMKTVGSLAEPQGFTAPQSKTAILSGSCSEATLLQLENAKKTMAYFELDATSIMAGDAVSEAALAWARQKFEQSDAPVLFYSSTDPETLAKIQATSNRTSVGDAVENTIGAIARGLEEMGVRQFIVAGGETSGAVIKALNVTAMEIGPPIDPGVPWTKSLTNKPLALALKSGNFGAEDFFTKAYAQIKDLAANS